MSTNSCDTAILLFSRSAVGESVAKPLVPHAKRISRALSANLIRYTRGLARLSGLPVVFISEHHQQGDNFGERFSHAIQQVFNRGFSNVIAIGNDCPALRPSDLTDAAEQLRAHALVIGPATDGGAYLIGLQRSIFDPQTFAAIPWQTSAVYESLTLQYAQGDFIALEIKSDLDTEADIYFALHRHQFLLPWSIRIWALLSALGLRIVQHLEYVPSAVPAIRCVSRGPPTFSFPG